MSREVVERLGLKVLSRDAYCVEFSNEFYELSNLQRERLVGFVGEEKAELFWEDFVDFVCEKLYYEWQKILRNCGLEHLSECIWIDYGDGRFLMVVSDELFDEVREESHLEALQEAIDTLDHTAIKFMEKVDAVKLLGLESLEPRV